MLLREASWATPILLLWPASWPARSGAWAKVLQEATYTANDQFIIKKYCHSIVVFVVVISVFVCEHSTLFELKPLGIIVVLDGACIDHKLSKFQSINFENILTNNTFSPESTLLLYQVLLHLGRIRLPTQPQMKRPTQLSAPLSSRS